MKARCAGLAALLCAAGCESGADDGVCEMADFDANACGEAVGESFCAEGQTHVAEGTEIVWDSNPPHSGDHYGMWADWGEHTTTLNRGNWVHNLEHGGVVFPYLCPSGCDAELDVLRDVMAQRPDMRIILTPDPALEGTRFAAVSWTWVHKFDTPNLDELLCFVDQHEGHAPEDIP